MDLDSMAGTRAAPSLVPFAVAAILAWATVVVGTTIDWPLYGVSAALLTGAGVLAALRATGRWRARYAATFPALVFLAAVALLRNSAGGINSGAAVVSLIPVFYTALYSETRHQIYVVLAGVAVFYLAPIVIVGPPAYPHLQYRAALLTVAVSSIIGLATRRLVADVRHEAGEALVRERMLGQVNDIFRGLYTSPQARAEVCEAARSISEASIAVLYEPVAGADVMRSTAIAGLDAGPREISTLEPGAVADTFASGQSRLISGEAEGQLGSLELWPAGRRPASVLCEPLMRGGQPLGVLVVGWPSGVEASSPRVSVVGLLAHEAAAVLDRADALSALSDMASTDPLTGLPNRRAWDARVARALAASQQFTIAMFDFDHFKLYNDTHGHPAGDRLLKETAAVWREQLRGGDLLARLGGEEFGLLLLDCDNDRAIEVIERLRALIFQDQTCSAGFAARRPGESAEAVMWRADRALYDAKAQGRDRVCMSA